MRNVLMTIAASLVIFASTAAVNAEVIIKKTVVRPARTVCTTHVGVAGRVTKVCRVVH